MLHLSVSSNNLGDRAGKVEVSEGRPYPPKSPSMYETNGEWKGNEDKSAMLGDGSKYYKVILYH